MTTTIELIGARGGQGTSTVAAVLALLHAHHRPTNLVTQDPLATAALVGVPLGLEDEAVQVTPTLLLTTTAAEDAEVEVVVLDAGQRRETERGSGTTQRLAVLRGPCYLALATLLASRPTYDGVVVVAEDGRSLTARDVHDVLGVPVVATVKHSPRIARTIDAGLLVARLHRMHEFHELRALAQPPPTPDRALPKSDTALLLPKVGKSRTHVRCRVHPSHAHVWRVCKDTKAQGRARHRPTESGRRRLLPRRGRVVG